MARRDETVWCGIFDDLAPGGIAIGTVKLDGAPCYVFQVRAQPPQKWRAVIMMRKEEPLVECDSAEAAKFAVEHMCATKVKGWVEGYWDDDVWMPKTSRPATVCAFKGPDPEPMPLMEAITGRKRKRAKL